MRVRRARPQTKSGIVSERRVLRVHGVSAHDQHAVTTGGWPNRLIAIRRYPVAVPVGNLVWERAECRFTRCLPGDLVTATVALGFAVARFGGPASPGEESRSVLDAVIVDGVAYTIDNEYANSVLRVLELQHVVPTLPALGLGLAALTQWSLFPRSPPWDGKRPARADRHTSTFDVGLEYPRFTPGYHQPKSRCRADGSLGRAIEARSKICKPLMPTSMAATNSSVRQLPNPSEASAGPGQ